MGEALLYMHLASKILTPPSPSCWAESSTLGLRKRGRTLIKIVAFLSGQFSVDYGLQDSGFPYCSHSNAIHLTLFILLESSKGHP